MNYRTIYVSGLLQILMAVSSLAAEAEREETSTTPPTLATTQSMFPDDDAPIVFDKDALKRHLEVEDKNALDPKNTTDLRALNLWRYYIEMRSSHGWWGLEKFQLPEGITQRDLDGDAFWGNLYPKMKASKTRYVGDSETQQLEEAEKERLSFHLFTNNEASISFDMSHLQKAIREKETRAENLLAFLKSISFGPSDNDSKTYTFPTEIKPEVLDTPDGLEKLFQTSPKLAKSVDLALFEEIRHGRKYQQIQQIAIILNRKAPPFKTPKEGRRHLRELNEAQLALYRDQKSAASELEKMIIKFQEEQRKNRSLEKEASTLRDFLNKKDIVIQQGLEREKARGEEIQRLRQELTQALDTLNKSSEKASQLQQLALSFIEGYKAAFPQ